jgi:hypothetical protein
VDEQVKQEGHVSARRRMGEHEVVDDDLHQRG